MIVKRTAYDFRYSDRQLSGIVVGVSEEVNRKSPPRNNVQPPTATVSPTIHIVTDNDSMMPIADLTVSSSVWQYDRLVKDTKCMNKS